MDLEQFLSKQDDLIKQGQIELCKAELKRLKNIDIPRQLKGQLANIYRRTGQSLKTVRLLNGILRPQGPLLEPATSTETLEYGIALVYVGAVMEGLRLLKSVSSQNEPQRDLLIAFSYFTRWEYAKALPYLENYIHNQDLTPYQRLVGRINLSSALVTCGQFEKADLELEDVFSITKEQNLQLLNGFSLELLAQSQLLRPIKNFSKAEIYLNLAKSKVSQNTKYSLWIRKWNAISELFQGKGHNELIKIRQEAIDVNNYETIRECDTFLSTQEKNENLFFKVYFGTPYPAYRKRIRQNYELQNGAVIIPQVGLIGPETVGDIFDADQGRLRSSQAKISTGLPCNFLRCLLKDRYKPTPTAALFHFLYPNEFFNPHSSPNRIYVLKSRLSSEIKNLKFPFEIRESSHGYWVKHPDDLSIQVSLKIDKIKDARLRDLLPKLNREIFTTQDVAQALNVSLRSAQRWIKKHVDGESIVQISESKPHVYKKVS